MKLFSEARFDIDRRCNYRCEYCSSFDDKDLVASPYPLDKIDEALTKLSEICWSIWLSCAGEPLMHPDFPMVMDIVNSRLKNTDTSLVTNGYLLGGEKLDALVQSSINRVFVSIDTINEEVYNYLCHTKSGSVSRVVTQVEQFTAKRHQTSPRVFLIAIAMKSTLPGLLELCQWAAAAGLDGIQVHWFVSTEMPHMQQEVVTHQEAMPYLQAAAKFMKKSGLFFEYPHETTLGRLRSIWEYSAFVSRKLGYFGCYLNKYIADKKSEGCRMAGTSLNIDNSGEVFICPALISSAGNLHIHSAAEIKRKIRDLVDKRNAGLFKECRECFILKEAHIM